MTYPIETQFAFLVLVKVGNDWVPLPGQRKGQTYEEMQAIYARGTAKGEQVRTVCETWFRRDVNPERRS